MKTLQQQYLLIKEGKGNKDHFLKQARNLFPEFITSGNDYNSATQILKGKGILSEAVGGVIGINPNSKPDWFKIFNTNLKENKLEENESYDKKIDLIRHEVDYVPDEIEVYKSWPEPYRSKALKALEYRKNNFKQMSDYKRDMFKENIKEAIGVKNTKEYGDQNEFEKIDSETQKTLDKANFDYKDEKNIDNVYGQSFLMGYYTEMKDPKNADKTVDELKAIVLKNMVKDVTYYNTKTSFGVKDIGYTKDVVSGGDPIAPKGKYKSSGYGDMPKAKIVKEGKDDDKIAKYKKYTYTLDGKKVTPDDIDFYDNLLGAELDGKVYKMGTPDENGNVELRAAKGKTGMYTESLNEGKSKKPTVDSHIKEIEKASAVAALESKLNAVKEAIETRESKLQVAESEDLAEMIDKSMIKKIQQEIKQLEKYKMQCEKQLSKLGGKTAVVDNEEVKENYDIYKYAVLDNDKKEVVHFETEEEAMDYISEKPETRKMNENSYYK
jgi:hypothetical protein